MPVFFDLDGTLCHVDDGRGNLLRECLLDCGVEKISRNDYLRVHQNVLENGKVRNRVPIFRELLGNVGVNDDDLAREVAFSYREKVLNNLVLYDGVDVLEEIDDALVLITNGPKETQWEKIREVGLDSYFDEVIISGEVGFAKPDPLIFKIAHIRAGEKGPYVGNSPMHDVKGSKEAGFCSVLVDRGVEHDGEADFVIDSLVEIRDVLDI